MAKALILFLLSLASLSLSSSSAAVGDSVHSLLRDHGLPAGLLPESVQNYTLDQTTSLLTVQLDRPCLAEYERSPVRFEQQINANLTFGSLKGVRGLTQEELFLWLPIKEILVADPKSGVILFDIGMAHKQLSLSIFESPPDCKAEEGGQVCSWTKSPTSEQHSSPDCSTQPSHGMTMKVDVDCNKRSQIYTRVCLNEQQCADACSQQGFQGGKCRKKIFFPWCYCCNGM